MKSIDLGNKHRAASNNPMPNNLKAIGLALHPNALYCAAYVHPFAMLMMLRALLTGCTAFGRHTHTQEKGKTKGVQMEAGEEEKY